MAAAADDVAQPSASKANTTETPVGATEIPAEKAPDVRVDATEKTLGSAAKEAEKEGEGTSGKETVILPPRALNPMEIEKLLYSLMEVPPSDFEKRLPNV